MDYAEFTPTSALRGDVRCYWMLGGGEEPHAPSADPAFPDGSPELILILADAFIDLAKRLGTTPRTLQRRFATDVGITPKLLARIVRFQRVFSEWRADPTSLSRVAAECGYYDHAQLVRAPRADRRLRRDTERANFGVTTSTFRGFSQ